MVNEQYQKVNVNANCGSDNRQQQIEKIINWQNCKLTNYDMDLNCLFVFDEK